METWLLQPMLFFFLPWFLWLPGSAREVDGLSAPDPGQVTDTLTQGDLDYLGNYLRVSFQVKANMKGKSYVAINIKNDGPLPVSKGGWGIYFCVFSSIQPSMFGSSVSPFELSHVHGCVHSIQPAPYFTSLEPMRSNTIDLVSSTLKFVGRTDTLPNWYVGPVGEWIRDRNLVPILLNCTTDVMDFVEPFTKPSQWKEDPDDPVDPLTPQERFARYLRVQPIPDPSSLPILPSVLSQRPLGDDKDSLQLSAQWAVSAAKGPLCAGVADLLAELMGLQRKESCMTDCIQFDSSSQHSLVPDIHQRTIALSCSNSEAGFLSAMTVLSYWERDGVVPNSIVDDSPRFPYRGLMVDISRSFHSVKTLKKLLDVMMRYKLNRLHLHLADDEGWRLEITDLPELTQIGATRCFDLTATQCLFTGYGHPPTKVSQFLNKEEYIDLVKYAGRRFIQIIPEIDTPGHSEAAIIAMEARQRRLLSEGRSEEEANAYILTEGVRDRSMYRSVQGYTHNVICPCIPSTLTFLRHVIKVIIEYHAEAGHPLDLIHLGGDEVPSGVWRGSPACAELMKEKGFGQFVDVGHKVMRHYVIEMSRLTAELGVGMAMWQDGLMSHENGASIPYTRSQLPNPNIVAFIWLSDFLQGEAKNPIRLANEGYKIVQAPATHLYLDHKHEADPDERGMHWATRAISVNRSFSFTPDDIYNSIVGPRGEIISRRRVCRRECATYTEAGRQNLLGIEGAVWGELVHTSSQLEWMAFPRLLAIAERAWHKATWETTAAVNWADLEKDLESFSNVLGAHELPRLSRLGVHYHISPPGVNWMPTYQLYTATEFPGQAVVVSVDNGQTWTHITSSHYMTDNEALFATRSPDMRLSRPVAVKHGRCEENCLSLYSLLFVVGLLTLKLFHTTTGSSTAVGQPIVASYQ